MHILVTGASGLIGNAICLTLLLKGYKVTGIVNSKISRIQQDNYKEYIINLLDYKPVLSEHIDAVIHCAAVIPKPGQRYTEDEIELMNQRIDHSIFEFCAKRKIRLIYFSTVYFYKRDIVGKLNENTPLIPDLKGYYKSKICSELHIEKHKLNAVIFRISSPYGDLLKQSNVMRIFSDQIRNGAPVTLIDKGQREQNFIHVDDISTACEKMLDRDSVGVFNLAFKESYSMLQLANYLRDICGSSSPIVFDPLKKDVYQNSRFDISKLSAELHWEPSLNLRSGLLKTLAV